MRKKLSEVDLELLAMVQENYFALLNHPLDSWRVHNQRALVNALNMVCYVTGESAQEAQDRCERVKGDMAIIAEMRKNGEL